MHSILDKLEAQAKAAYKQGFETVDVEKTKLQPKAALKTAKEAVSEGGMKAQAFINSAIRQRPSQIVKIMLIGAPGHGKSRLGSFLISPDDTMDVNNTNCAPAFKFSAQAQAFTQDISSQRAVIDGTMFELVDTPGIGENPAKDLEHILQVVRYLQKAEQISAVIFVLSGRFEREGRELVNFLKNLLGNHIIQTNLVLVVTKISQSKAAERDRQHENKPVDVLMAEYQNVVQQEFGLQTGLPVIDIDTCPGSEDESRIALTRRMKICCLVESLPPVKASDLAIPKMAHLVAEDKKQQCQLEKVIDGLQDSLLAANEDEMQILQELEEHTRAAKDLDLNLQSLRLTLADMSSDELEKCGHESGARPTSFFLARPLFIDAESKTVVESYTTQVRDPEDEVEVKKLSSTKYRMIVKPNRHRFGSCRASITLYAKRKDINARAVKQLKVRVEDHEQAREVQLRLVKLIEGTEFVKMQSIPKIQADIAVAQKEIARLSKDTMSIDEAVQRLTELQKHVS